MVNGHVQRTALHGGGVKQLTPLFNAYNSASLAVSKPVGGAVGGEVLPSTLQQDRGDILLSASLSSFLCQSLSINEEDQNLALKEESVLDLPLLLHSLFCIYQTLTPEPIFRPPILSDFLTHLNHS